jgi:REP element-mobilizing transposase RayT
MPRKLRLEEEGGLYHVINRGNYRTAIFGTEGAKAAFEKALAETLGQYGWRLHAYVIMSNHYHLAVETPQPNLSGGMHALQSTFATRFNRLRKERGHVFQGRYQSLLVENSEALCRLVDYIHLNPVRAGLETVETLGTYPWGSLRRFAQGKALQGQVGDIVMAWRELENTPKAWLGELRRLRELANDPSEQKRLGFGQMSRGWAIGTNGWRKALAKEYTQLSLIGMSRDEASELREARWEAILEEYHRKWGIGNGAARAEEISAVEVGSRLEAAQSLRMAGVPYRWIADRLGLGNLENLRIRLYRMRNVTM